MSLEKNPIQKLQDIIIKISTVEENKKRNIILKHFAKNTGYTTKKRYSDDPLYVLLGNTYLESKNVTSNFLETIKKYLGIKNNAIVEDAIEYLKSQKRIKKGNKKISSSNEINEQKDKPSKGLLENRSFYFFERFGVNDPRLNKQSDNWAVNVAELDYKGKLKESTQFQLKRKTFGGITVDYVGTTTSDHNQYFFDLKSNLNNRVNIVVDRFGSVEEQSVYIGHFTFYSDYFKRTLTKIILLVDKSLIKVEELPIDLGRIEYNSDYFESLPKEVKIFLQGRISVRINTPFSKNFIFDLDSLGQYLLNHREENVNKNLEKFFKGNFDVFYEKSNGTMVNDEIEINFSNFYNRMEVIYAHKTKKLYGKPYFNNGKILIFELSEDFFKEKENVKEENPILLMCNVPLEGDDAKWVDLECFPSILCGLEDESSTDESIVGGGIALHCLVVKKGLITDMNNDDRINSYFDKYENKLVKLQKRNLFFYLDDIISIEKK